MPGSLMCPLDGYYMFAIVMVLYQQSCRDSGKYSTWLAAFVVGKKNCYFLVTSMPDFLMLVSHASCISYCWCTFITVKMYAKLHEILPILTSVAQMVWFVASVFLPHLDPILVSIITTFISDVHIYCLGFGVHCGFSSNRIILLLELPILLQSF